MFPALGKTSNWIPAVKASEWSTEIYWNIQERHVNRKVCHKRLRQLTGARWGEKSLTSKTDVQSDTFADCLLHHNIPSWEPTYPILGKGKSSTQKWICDRYLEDIFTKHRGSPSAAMKSSTNQRGWEGTRGTHQPARRLFHGSSVFRHQLLRQQRAWKS